MSDLPIRVILLVLDGVADHALTPEPMPRLWALSEAGGRRTGTLSTPRLDTEQ